MREKKSGFDDVPGLIYIDENKAQDMRTPRQFMSDRATSARDAIYGDTSIYAGMDGYCNVVAVSTSIVQHDGGCILGKCIT